MTHAILTDHPVIVRTQARVDEVRKKFDGISIRDQDAQAQWQADAVAAARAGKPSPEQPTRTPVEVREVLARDLSSAEAVHRSAIVDIAPEVEAAARKRQSAIMVEVAALEGQLDVLASELHELAGACNQCDHARNLPYGHAMHCATAAELLKAARTGELWVH